MLFKPGLISVAFFITTDKSSGIDFIRTKSASKTIIVKTTPCIASVQATDFIPPIETKIKRTKAKKIVPIVEGTCAAPSSPAPNPPNCIPI